MPTKETTGLRRELLLLLPPALLLLLLLQTATNWDAGHRELGLAVLAVVVTQVLPGALVWRLIRPVDGWLVEDLVVGLAVGAVMMVGSHLVSAMLGVTALDAVIPLGIAAATLLVPSSRRRILSRRNDPLPWAWGLAVAACCIAPVIDVLAAFRQPIRWHGWAVPYVDVPFHQALAGELANRFPPHYPQVAGETLNYHWFVHAWTAATSNLTGTPVEVLLWRFNPSLLAVAVPLMTAVVALRLSRSPWIGVGACAIAFVAMDPTPWMETRLSTPLHSYLSPTQEFGLLILLPLLSLMAMRWRGAVHPASVLLLAPMLLVAGGSKGSLLPVLVAGGIVASVAVLKFGGPRRTVWLDTTLAAAAMVFLTLTMFGGGSGGIKLAWIDVFIEERGRLVAGGPVDAGTAGGILAGGLFLLPLILGHVGAVAALTQRELRRDPMVWLLVGCLLAGFGALLLLTHPGFAQFYFYRSAEAPMAILAAWGLGTLVAARERPGRLVLGGVAIGVGSLYLVHVLMGVDEVGPGVNRAVLALALFAGLVALASLAFRRSAPMVALVAVTACGMAATAEKLADYESPEDKLVGRQVLGSVHHSELRAAHWIRDHSDPDDVVMSNRHCRAGLGATCDHRRFVLAGYSQRRVLVEGWAYTKGAREQFAKGAGPVYSQVPFWDNDLLALNDAFFTAPTAHAARELYDLGVRWVAVDRRAPHAATLEPLAKKRLSTRFTIVYELPEPE